MIDIAPVYNGYPADYTINHVMGSDPDLEALTAYARDVSIKIAGHVKEGMVVADVFHRAQEFIGKNPDYTLAYPPFISVMNGLWTIEPYIMYKDRAAKFEQLVFIGKETVIL